MKTECLLSYPGKLSRLDDEELGRNAVTPSDTADVQNAKREA